MAYLRRHPLSRTYGAILQSSLTTVLPSALVFSTHLPVSVLVRSHTLQHLEAFLGRPSNIISVKADWLITLYYADAFTFCQLSYPHGHFYSPAYILDAVPPSLHAVGQEY